MYLSKKKVKKTKKNGMFFVYTNPLFDIFEIRSNAVSIKAREQKQVRRDDMPKRHVTQVTRSHKRPRHKGQPHQQRQPPITEEELIQALPTVLLYITAEYLPLAWGFPLNQMCMCPYLHYRFAGKYIVALDGRHWNWTLASHRRGELEGYLGSITDASHERIIVANQGHIHVTNIQKSFVEHSWQIGAHAIILKFATDGQVYCVVRKNLNPPNSPVWLECRSRVGRATWSINLRFANRSDVQIRALDIHHGVVFLLAYDGSNKKSILMCYDIAQRGRLLGTYNFSNTQMTSLVVFNEDIHMLNGDGRVWVSSVSQPTVIFRTFQAGTKPVSIGIARTEEKVLLASYSSSTGLVAIFS